MKTIIIYQSTHHGNTKKLVDAIAAQCGAQAVPVDKAAEADLTAYDCIGIASGVAFGRFYPAAAKFMKEQLPEGRTVFFLYTCGKELGTYTNAARRVLKAKGCRFLGSYGCLGYDTFGPFRLIGGIAKGHPTAEEIAGAVDFYREIEAAFAEQNGGQA